MSMTTIIAIVAIVAVIAFLVAQRSGPRITTIKRHREDDEGEKGE